MKLENVLGGVSVKISKSLIQRQKPGLLRKLNFQPLAADAVDEFGSCRLNVCQVKEIRQSGPFECVSDFINLI
jgi:hypothetical protein